MDAPVTVYHNASCSKSNGVVELLTERDVPFSVRYYLEEPLSEEELRALLKKLALPASAIVRRGDTLVDEFTKGGEPDEGTWIRILSANPILIERPIVEAPRGAIIARPPERALDIL